MLNAYKNSDVWRKNLDGVNLRSDILVSERVVDMLGDVKGKKILDLGCGNGKVARMLYRKGAHVVGVDAVEDQINIAIENSPSHIEYHLGDVLKLNELNLPKDFDICISLMTFLHFNESQFLVAAKEIQEHLKPGGRLIYGDINPQRFFGKYKQDGKTTYKVELNTVDKQKFTVAFYIHPMNFIHDVFTGVGFEMPSVMHPMATEEEIAKYPDILTPENDIPLYAILDMSMRQ
ncbi:MAG: class I SAM-dependent methyltransferase [Patescibacteria group bacterium]